MCILVVAIGVGRQVVGSDNSPNLRLSHVEPNETVRKGILGHSLGRIPSRRMAYQYVSTNDGEAR